MSRLAARSAVIVCLLTHAGCRGGDGPPLLPVAGMVRVRGVPLPQGTLSLRPDRSRGNNGDAEPAGKIDGNGHYELVTAGRAGAPPGWYKVLLISAAPVDPLAPYAPRASLVSAKYARTETTDLRLEVAESAPRESYDLNVER